MRGERQCKRIMDEMLIFFKYIKKSVPPFPAGRLIHEVMALYLKSVIVLVHKEAPPPRHHSN